MECPDFSSPIQTVGLLFGSRCHRSRIILSLTQIDSLRSFDSTRCERPKADTHCLVALCASSATVLLTLHPSASVPPSEKAVSIELEKLFLVRLCFNDLRTNCTLVEVVQKIQYNAKDDSQMQREGDSLERLVGMLALVKPWSIEASWVPDATWLRMESQDSHKVYKGIV